MLRPLMLVAALCAARLSAFPNGAPTEACLRGMVPNHQGVAAQDPSTNPYTITRQAVDDGVRVTIMASGDTYFKGFMVQARDPSTGDFATALGSWRPVEHVNLLNECASLTHADRNDKTGASITWAGARDIDVHVTVLESFDRFWADLEAVEVGPEQSPAIGSQQRFFQGDHGVVTEPSVVPQAFTPVVDQSHFDPQRFFLQ